MSKNKPEYHQSRLKNYFKCPAMFDLSLRIEPEYKAGTLNIFREGNLFEGYVLGFKDDKDEDELIGRKKEGTINAIKGQAECIKPVFKSGEAYVKLRHETDDYVLAGEADQDRKSVV